MTRTEKKRLRERQAGWWLQLSELKWRSLGVVEAKAALSLMDSFVGSRLLSLRRMLAAFAIASLSFLFSDYPRSLLLIDFDPSGILDADFVIVSFLILFVFIALSLSVTRSVSLATTRSPPSLLGVAFIALLAVNVLLFMVWKPIANSLYSGLSTFYFTATPGMWIWDWSELVFVFLMGARDGPISGVSVRVWPQEVADLLTNGIRIAFSALFFLSFLSLWIRNFVFRLWAQVIDSDKPFFTIIVGGATTAITTIHAILTKLG